MSQSFPLNDLRLKFLHVFVEVLKLPVGGMGLMRWIGTANVPKSAEGGY